MDSAVKLIECIPRFENEKYQKVAVRVVGITVASTILYTSYKFKTTAKNKKRQGRNKEIPVPGSCYPYVGHLFSLGDLPGKTISKWHAKLGPILKLKMGAKTWITIDDPALTHKIFVTNGAETSYRHESVYTFKHYSMGGKGIAFAQPGSSLKKNRSAALSVLAPKMIVNKYMELIEQESYDLVSRFIASSETEGGTDPIKYLQLYSMNVMFLACFGRKFDDIKDPEFIRLSTFVNTSMKYAGIENDLTNFLPIFSIYDYFTGSQAVQKKFIETERDPVFKNYVREAAVREGSNVVKSLEESDFHFTEDEKIVFTSDLIIAGTDNNSITSQWSFAIMCNYPEVQRKIAAEIDQFTKLNGRVPKFTERTEVPYCLSVMKECMRFRPTTAFGIPHAVHKDIEVDGYIIPKGSSIVPNLDSLHTQIQYYPDPHVFHPERFMSNLKTMQSAANGRVEERDHYNFGFGRRICPGIYLAETELFCAFIQVFARTFIEPVNGIMPDIENIRNGGLALLPFSFKVKFVKRESSIIQ